MNPFRGGDVYRTAPAHRNNRELPSWPCPFLSFAAIVALWRRRLVAGAITTLCVGIMLVFMLVFHPIMLLG